MSSGEDYVKEKENGAQENIKSGEEDGGYDFYGIVDDDRFQGV